MNRALQGLLFATLVLAASCKPAEQNAPPAPSAVATVPPTVSTDAAEPPKPEMPVLVVDTFDGGKFDIKLSNALFDFGSAYFGNFGFLFFTLSHQ